jgi:hypothetical protein
MSPPVETLDEVIDRVAAELTQAPPVVGMGERVAVRIDRRRGFSLWIPAAAVAALAWTVVSVLPIRQPSSDRPALVRDEGRAVVEAPTREERVNTIQPLVPAVQQRSQTRAAPTGFSVRIDAPSAIPALAPPAALVLEDVALEALSVPSVAIDSLEVATLAIEELTISEKEQP